MQSGVRVVGAYLEGDLRVVGDRCRVVGAYLDWDLRVVGYRCRVVASILFFCPDSFFLGWQVLCERLTCWVPAGGTCASQSVHWPLQ